MSYDLMVFDPVAPPKDRDGFMRWYDHQTKWSEGHDYLSPAVSTPELHAWFLDMIKEYPPIEGPYASDDDDGPGLASYSAGKSLIYVCFAWPEAENAYNSVFRLAKQHQVGFFDASATNGQVWLPDSSGEFICIHGG